MNKVGNTNATSTESLMWQARAVSRELELATKRDSAIASRGAFEDALRARAHAAEARFAKGIKENKSSVWSTAGMVAGLVIGAVVASALAVPTGGLSVVAGVLVALATGGVGAISKIICAIALDRGANADERRAAEADLRASAAQKASDAAKEEAAAAQDRFRSILEDAKTADQIALRAFQRD